ncbi:MAG: OmpH family outer membrane protein [Prevotella sp.]|nr:OmpH family outer membrane protein [Prevotella sp.]
MNQNSDKQQRNKTWLKAIFLFYLFAFLPLNASAQIRFGYFSYEQVFRNMPQYSIMQRNMDNLEAQYDAEMKRAEDEFNSKYEDFLLHRSTYAEPIKQKRQAELQALMEKNIAFKKEANRLLEAARRDAEMPLKQMIAEALATIGQQGGYAFILNTDNNAVPFIDPALGEDITQQLKQRLEQNQSVQP